jgi:ribose-phosphate pyrophosphokinase
MKDAAVASLATLEETGGPGAHEIALQRRALLLSGTSNRPLAAAVASELGQPLGQVEVNRFACGEVYVRLLDSVRGSDAFVIQSHSHPVDEMLMEQLVMIDALKRASVGHVTAVIPYLGYSRQDQKSLEREPISARLVADMLTVAGADRVMVIDLHTGQIQGFFKIPVDHLTAVPALAAYVGRRYPGDLVVVSPDAGRGKMAQRYARHLNASIAFMEKARSIEQHNVSRPLGLIGDVAGRRCMLIDDMIDTGGTISDAAKALRDAGATEIVAAATHGLFSGSALERLEASPLVEAVVTDTVRPPQELPAKLTVVSVASLLASSIGAAFQDRSVSAIFNPAPDTSKKG